jgi:FkbM family methyltransferase
MVSRWLRKLIFRFRPYYLSLLGMERTIPPPKDFAPKLYAAYVDKSDVVVEVGAYLGGGTILLATLARYVYSFDPSEDNFDLLRWNTTGYRNIKLFNIGLSDKNGDEELYTLRKNEQYASSLKKIKGYDYPNKEKIRVKRLDDLKFDKKINSIVIDCEGQELEVLKGARRTIPTLKSMLIETHRLANGENTLESVLQELRQYEDLFEIRNSTFQHSNTNPLWIMGRKKALIPQ